MKLSYVLAAAIAALSIVACEKEAAIDTPNGDEVEVQTPGLVKKTFYATVEGSEPATKALLYDTNKTKWESTDAISVFVDDNTTNYEMTASAEGASTGFTGTIADGSNYIAVYPYSSSIVFTPANAKPVEYSIPSVQEATLDSFDPKAAVFIADTDDKSNNLTFKAAFALLKVSVDKDNVLAVYVENATLPMSGSIAINTSAEVEDGSGDKFTWVSLKKSDGTALVQGDYYIVVRYLDAAPYETFKLTYIQDDATSNTRSAASLPAASLGRNDILRLGSLTSIDAKYTPAVSWFNYYQACLNVTIAGKEFDRLSDGDAVLVAPGTAAQLPLSAKVNFLKGGTHVNTNMQKPSERVAMKSNNPSDKAVLKPQKTWVVLDFAIADIDFDLTDQTGATMFSNNSDYLTADAAYFNMENCTVSIPATNQTTTTFYATQTAKTLYSVVSFDIEHCRFVTPGVGDSPGNKTLLATLFSINKAHTKAENIKSFVFSNNVFCYTGEGGYKAQVFNYGTNASSTTETDWDMSVEFNNNIIYNIASSSGFFRTQWIKKIQMSKNVFVVPDDFNCGGDPKFYAMLAEPSSKPTGVLADNIVKGTTTGTWKTTSKAKMNVAGLADTSVDVKDGSLVLFSSATPEEGTFTMAAGYESYGPQ